MKFLSLKARAIQRETFESYWNLQGLKVSSRVRQYLGVATYGLFNPSAPELFSLILAHPVYKTWIIQEPNKLALWNKLHFEEKKKENIERV